MDHFIKCQFYDISYFTTRVIFYFILFYFHYNISLFKKKRHKEIYTKLLKNLVEIKLDA